MRNGEGWKVEEWEGLKREWDPVLKVLRSKKKRKKEKKNHPWL